MTSDETREMDISLLKHQITKVNREKAMTSATLRLKQDQLKESAKKSKALINWKKQELLKLSKQQKQNKDKVIRLHKR